MVETYERHYANVHRGIHRLADRTTELYEGAREKVAAVHQCCRPQSRLFLLRGRPRESTSWRGVGAMPTFAKGTKSFSPDGASLEPRALATIGRTDRGGDPHIPVTDDGRLELEALDSLLTSRTRIVAVTAVSNVLGTINPIDRDHPPGSRCGGGGARRRRTERAAPAHRRRGAGHRFPRLQRAQDARPLRGSACFTAKRELLEAMPPFLGGGSMIRRVTLEGFEPADVPARFEAGTPAIVPAIGLGAAVDYLSAVGMDAIRRHEAAAHRACSPRAGIDRRPADPRSQAAGEGRHREFHARSHPPSRRGATSRPRERSRARRASLRHAAAQAIQGRRHHTGELLLLQHARRDRPPGRGDSKGAGIVWTETIGQGLGRHPRPLGLRATPRRSNRANRRRLSLLVLQQDGASIK